MRKMAQATNGHRSQLNVWNEEVIQQGRAPQLQSSLSRFTGRRTLLDAFLLCRPTKVRPLDNQKRAIMKSSI
jgi:hypothetical protein